MVKGIIFLTAKKLVDIQGIDKQLCLDVQCGDEAVRTNYAGPPYNYNLVFSFQDEGSRYIVVKIEDSEENMVAKGNIDIEEIKNAPERTLTGHQVKIDKYTLEFDGMFVKMPESYGSLCDLSVYNDGEPHEELKTVKKARVELCAAPGMPPAFEKTFDLNPHGGSFNNIFPDIPYKNEQEVDISLIDASGHTVAVTKFNIWHHSHGTAVKGECDSARRGYLDMNGGIPLMSPVGANLGKIGLRVNLRDPNPPTTTSSKSSVEQAVVVARNVSKSSSSRSQHSSSSSVEIPSNTSSKKAKSVSKSSSKKVSKSSSVSYSYGSYEDSVLPTVEREIIFDTCREFTVNIEDEFARAIAAQEKGVHCDRLHGEPGVASAERALKQTEHDINTIQKIQWKVAKAVEANKHVVYPYDLDELENYCRNHAVRTRKTRVDVEKKILRLIAEITEDEAKRAKRAAHTCRALAGHFEEKCEKHKCKELQTLVDENTRICGLAVESAKDTKLAVKHARKCDLSNVVDKMEKARDHRTRTEKYIDELNLNMSMYGDALTKFNRKKEKKARLKEEAALLAMVEFERMLSNERHMRYEVDMKRPVESKHEVSYHAARTATYNHDYNGADHHPTDSAAHIRRQEHRTVNEEMVNYFLYRDRVM